jgi:glycosyltransferase involved in cell wall biosynthesis
MKRKPRLLFLAFAFPPMRTVASVRAANVAKFLSRLGWDVSVVTPHPSLLQSPDDPSRVAAELEQSGIRMIYSGHRWRCLSTGHLKRTYRRGLKWLLEGIPRRLAKAMHIDEMVGWYGEAERSCAKLQPGDVDVVLATGGPFGAFQIAERLGRRLQCPYVLDYRDLWTGNPHTQSAWWERHRNVEQRLLTGCAAVSVVSPSMAGCLGEHFNVAEKVHVIPNGYDPADLDSIEPISFGHFAIVYAGLFLPPKRSAHPLMQALRRLAELEPARPWRFHYYGPCEDHVRESATACGVQDRVELHGTVPRRQCLAAIRGAGVAAVVVSVYDTGDLADRGIITGKIFEPIGLGTPTLVIAPPGSDVQAVIETVGKGAVFAGSRIDGMAAFLAGLIKGNIPESRQPEVYAWPQLIQQFDVMLRRTEKTGISHGAI